jgi:hypothetical protein
MKGYEVISALDVFEFVLFSNLTADKTEFLPTPGTYGNFCDLKLHFS